LMVRPGLINLDFADVRAVMDEMGKAMMGTGEAEGENRAIQAAEKAIANPLLDEISLEGAKGVLINITGGYDLTLFELDEAANKIREKVDPNANIIVGSTLDPSMEGKMRVSVVATGIDALAKRTEAPVARRSMAAPLAPIVEAAPVEEPEAELPDVAAMAQPAAAAAPQERTLFESFEAPAPQAQTYAPQREAASAPQTLSDDLPPPAYRPRTEPALNEADHFVAPRAQAPGTPSPEALARLQAAVNRVPKAETPRQPAPAAPVEAERPRFGINSLINRMTGAQADGHTPQPARAQPQVTALHNEPELSEEQEKIEIPAFLRRQAN
ncbi:MAG: cell division protein FtsZ, partial [Paracoccaceae bacterium]|nr:cell division protein FtsZ [Paracoccaceae bacterium]